MVPFNVNKMLLHIFRMTQLVPIATQKITLKVKIFVQKGEVAIQPGGFFGHVKKYKSPKI